MKTTLLIMLIVLILSFPITTGAESENINMSLGATTDMLPFAEMPHDSSIYKMDMGYNFRDDIWKALYWDREAYLSMMYNDKEGGGHGDLAGGTGIRLRSGISFTDNLRIFLGAGLLLLINGDDLDNLADSWLFGTMEGGIEYRKIFVCVGHISVPHKDHSDGDTSVNTINVGVKISF